MCVRVYLCLYSARGEATGSSISTDISASRPYSAGLPRYPQLMNAPTGLIVLVLNAVLLDVLLLWGDSRAAITVDGYAGGLGRNPTPTGPR